MRVKIRYPEKFPLEGWHKAMFGFRLASMFRCGALNVATLDHCRLSAGLEKADAATRRDFSDLHCEDFGRLPKEVLAELPARVSQYVGVEVARVPRGSIGLLLAAIFVLGVGFVAAATIAHVRDRSEEEAATAAQTLARAKPIAPPWGEPLPLQPVRTVQPLYAEPADPVFSASVTTATPRLAVERIASAIQTSGGRFDVSVSVTPAAANR